MLKIAHIITGLDTGGAETMLYNLLAYQQEDDTLQAEVYSLTDIGTTGQRIAALGLPVHALGMTPGLPNPLLIVKLARWLQENQFDVVQTWLYHADLVGSIAAKLAGNIPLAWCIQNTRLDTGVESSRTIWIAKQLAWLSRFMPDRIIAAAEAARKWHVGLGYSDEKMVIIPNGFDLTRFQPDSTARAEIRAELDIPPDAPVVGMVARFEPVKDHANFVAAAKALHEINREAFFVLAGKNVTWENDDLSAWIAMGDMQQQFRLLGLRNDAPRLFNALDVITLSSRSEALPLTIGEAMACGIPAVVTDVGDAALLVGDTGKIVPARNPEALSLAWNEILALPDSERHVLGSAARLRIEQHYSLPTIAAQYQMLWEEIRSSTTKK